MKSDKEDSVKRPADPAFASTLASNDDDEVDLGSTAPTLHEKVKLGSSTPKDARLVPIAVREVPVGTLFGNFEVVRKVGQGGMGVVYEAKHRHIGRKAAIKVMHREWAQRPDYTERFLNEARAVNIIQHPGLVEIFEYGQQSDGTLFIVMEFLQGESLEQRMQKAGLPLPEQAVIDIALQLARALTAAHEKGVIHRDLKPDNIMLVADPIRQGHDWVKILDFGIAKLNDGKVDPETTPTARAVERSSVMGTDQPFSTVRRGSLSGSVRYLVAEWMGWPRNRVMVYGLWDMDR